MIFSEMEVEYFPHLDCDVFIVKLSIFNFQFTILLTSFFHQTSSPAVLLGFAAGSFQAKWLGRKPRQTPCA